LRSFLLYVDCVSQWRTGIAPSFYYVEKRGGILAAASLNGWRYLQHRWNASINSLFFYDLYDDNQIFSWRILFRNISWKLSGKFLVRHKTEEIYRQCKNCLTDLRKVIVVLQYENKFKNHFQLLIRKESLQHEAGRAWSMKIRLQLQLEVFSALRPRYIKVTN
jgi:hypothetical protein